MNAPAKGSERDTSPHPDKSGEETRRTDLFADDSPLPWGVLSTLAALLTYLADPLGQRPQDSTANGDEPKGGGE